MSAPVENKNPQQNVANRLAEAIREVKNDYADRDDVVVDIREAQRTRLELLAEDLASVFADVPKEDERFDLVISAGSQPRLWIDAVSHVTMGRDRRTYRFLRDTRLGRVVLCESTDIKTVANQVTRYIAERMIERSRMMEGDVLPAAVLPAEAQEISAASGARKSGSSFARGLVMLLLGGLAGVGLILLLAWLQVA